MSHAIRVPMAFVPSGRALVQRAKPAAIAASVVLVLAASFFGGRAYQNSVDQPLISQYSPAAPSHGLSAGKLAKQSNLGGPGAGSGDLTKKYLKQK